MVSRNGKQVSHLFFSKHNFKFNFLFLSLILLIANFSLAQNPPWSVPDTVEGVWKTLNYTTEYPEALVKLQVVRDTLFGSIIDMIETQSREVPRCTLCVDSLRNVPLKGLKIVWGCTKKDRNWVSGKYLDISDGKVYRCEISMNDEGNLLVFTYVNRIFKLGRTLKWVRVQ